MHCPSSVLFVCLGNICRSPSAESVMRTKCEHAGLDVVFDSAGTASYHQGEMPDKRAIRIGKSLGYELSDLRARQVSKEDFYCFDFIFAMDKNNLKDLQILHTQAKLEANHQQVANLQLFDFTNRVVDDPYYGDDSDFLAMFAHIESVADKYLEAWQSFPKNFLLK